MVANQKAYAVSENTQVLLFCIHFFARNEYDAPFIIRISVFGLCVWSSSELPFISLSAAFVLMSVRELQHCKMSFRGWHSAV